jgi:filamentous hemagglutinin
MIFCIKLYHLTKNFLAQFALLSFILEQLIFISAATAQTLPITSDGSTNTQVTQTASGIDQINIAAPNSSGLSHNKFTDYNVNSAGQIINNFSSSSNNALTSTQIGGLVTANPNLVNSGSAKIILNEVTSGNVSQLLGYTEIAGTKADLILANPNGIACSGCGFINTARLLMVAGSSDFDSLGNLGFNLKEQANPNLYVPLITVEGLGLDISRTSSTDIIASSVKLLSSIYGSDNTALTIKTGIGRYDFTNKEITGDNTQNNTQAVFAIDASSIAKIQSGQIYLIATKKGVGVNMATEILASSTINIDANGDVYYSKISAGESANLKSTATIQSIDSDSEISAPSLTIQASEFKNLGSNSANNLNIQNSDTLTNFGIIESLTLKLSNISNINNSGSIFGQNSLNISGANLTNNSAARIYSPVDYKIALTGFLTNSGLINSASNLTINSNQLINNSEISAKNNLTLSTTTSATNSGNLIAVKDLNFTANSFTNSASIKSSGASIFNLSSLTNNKNSSIYADTTLTLNLSSDLTNSGSISAQRNLTVTGSSNITNSNKILSNSDINISAASFTNNQNAIISSLAKTLTITLTSNLQNDGNLNSETDLTFSSNSFSNSGKIIAGKTLQTKAENSDEITVSIASLGNLSIASKNSFTNSGNLQSTKNSKLNSGEVFSNSGNIFSYANLTISSTNFDNLAKVSGYLNNSGEISTTSAANLTFSNVINSNKILANSSLTINSASINNSSANSILASVNQDLNLNITDFLTNFGTIFAKTDLTLASEIQLNNFDNSGSISFNKLANSKSELKVTDFINSGKFYSNSTEDSLTINSSNSFTNSNKLSSGKNLTINFSGSFDNFANLSAANNLTLSSKSLSNNLTNSGQISALNDLTIDTKSKISNLGNILANNQINIAAINLNNGSSVNANAVISSLNGATTLTTSSDINNYGEISSKTALSLNAVNLFNYSNIIAATTLTVDNFGLINNLGNFQSADSTTLTSTSLTNSGKIYSKSKSEITNSSDLTNYGNIYAENSVTVTSKNLINQTGAILSANQNLTATTTNDITNSGSIAASNNLTLTAKNLTNSNLLQSGNNTKVTLTGNLTNNSKSTIYSGNDLEIKTTGTSSSIDNSGSFSAISAATFTSKTFINSNSILANNSLTVNSNSITNNSNSNLASINQNLNLNITDFLTNFGTISAKTNLTLGSETQLNNFNNSGSISFNKLTSTNSELKVTDFTNSGNFYSNSTADSLIITSSNSFTNSGKINSASSLNLNSKNLDNSGQISSLGSLTIIDSATITNSKQILASGALTITAQNLNSSADSIANLAIASLSDSLTLNIINQLTNSGQLSSSSDLKITANNFINNSNANVLAGAKLDIKTNSALNNSDNSIVNSGNFQSVFSTTLSSASLNNSGSIKSFATATINIASINNQDNAVIFSSSDAEIAANISLTNSGSILSSAILTITSAKTINNNQIYAVGNLTLNLTNTLTNNSSASLTSLGNLTINSSSSVTNYNQIASNSNIEITATSLTNSNKIQSNGNLTFNLGTLSNSKNIISAGTFTTTTSGSTSNSGTLQSGDKFTINATSLTNLANSLILSAKDLNITSNAIINQNTKPSTSTITSGIVSANGAITIKTDNFNNSSGIVAGKSTTLSALSAASVNLNNASGVFISTAAILLNLGNLNYTITGTVTASNVDITANNITNQGNVTASDYIKLNATGAAGVVDDGNITNEYVGGNSSVLASLSAGTYISLTAKNNINNYATIQGSTDTTLTATNGSINNYSTGKITGGSGTTTINATNNAFNNIDSKSLVTANKNAIFNVKNLNNNGEISAANDITTNITNNLNNNATALIWSGNDATFNVANNFTNSQAEIYANRNLTIQKNSSSDSSLNKTASVQNVSGNIQTYAGDIIIKTSSLENERSESPIIQLIQPSDYSYPNLVKWTNHDLYKWTDLAYSYCDGNYCERKRYYAYSASPDNINSVSANISSGGNLTLDSYYILNEISNIDAKLNINIFTQNLINRSISYDGWKWNYITSEGKVFNEYNQISDPLYKRNFYSYIKSGASLTITKNNTDATESFIKNDNNIQTNTNIEGASYKSQSTKINKIDIYTLGQTGIINVDLSSITSAISNNRSSTSGSSYSVSGSASNNNAANQVSSQNVKKGSASNLSATSSKLDATTSDTEVSEVDSKTITKNNVSDSNTDSTATPTTSDTIFLGNFKINLDPAATTPLIESRSQFTDISKFFGSEYYFNQLGLNGKKVLGDIEHQIRNPNPNQGNNDKVVRMLGDAFVENKLITDQLKNLTNDSLLLSKSTSDATAQVKELLDNSVTELTRLGLDAEEIATKGLTTAQANLLTKDIVTFELTSVNGIEVLAPKIYLSLDTRNRLLGNDSGLASNSTIFAGTNLTINAPTANLLNSGSIIAGNNLTLNVGSLTSESLNSNLSNASMLDLAKIKAGNDLTITTNNIAIPTLISASVIANSLSPTLTSSGITLNNTYLSSGGTTLLNSVGDINISNDKNLTLTALSASIPTLSSLSSFSAARSLSSIKDDAAAQRSALTFNSGSDIEITSLGSINIANNYTNTGGSIFMTAVNNINNSNFTVKASDNVVMEANNINNIATNNNSNETKIEAGNIVSLNATKDTNGNGGNITNIGATISGGSLVYLTADNNITNKALIEYNINGQTSYSSGLSNTQTAADFTNTTLDNTGISTSDTNVLNSNANLIRSNLIEQGNITSGGNLVLVAGNNINNIGSNITAEGSTYLESTNGNINITTSELRDSTVTSWGGKKKGGTSTTDNTINLSSEISSGGTLELASGTDINIKGSDLTTTNSGSNITLTAANDVNITAAQDTKYSQTQSWKKGTTVSKSSTSMDQTITNVKSELSSAGDISINSDADINLIGAKLSAINATLNAGDNINIYSVADQHYSYSASSKSRSFAEITKYVAPQIKLANDLFEVLPVPVLSNISALENSLANGNISASSNLNEKQTITNQGSDISLTGNLTITANSDLNIAGSKLSGSSADISSTTGDINIYNVKDSEYSRSESNKSTTTLSSVASGLIQTAAASISSVFTWFDPTLTPDQRLDKLKEHREQSSEIPQKQELHQKENMDETIVASGLTFANITINSSKDTNITSSNLTTTSGDLNIISGSSGSGSTNILTATENDYSFSYDMKKTPTIAAALSNSVAKVATDLTPSIGHSKSDNTKSNNAINELVYDKDSSKFDNSTSTNIASNLISAADLNITSQNNNLISGSALSATNINLTATDGATTITSVADSSSNSSEIISQDYKDFKLAYDRGRASANANSKVEESTSTTATSTQKSSTLDALGNISITSKKDLNILSSDLTADSGAISLTSSEGNVNILALSNTTSTTSETKIGTQTLSAGVGNNFVDTAYAEKDALDAIKAVADAKNNLNHMETLKANGQAEESAVEDAKINLGIATANLALAEVKLAASAAKSVSSAATLGFYADLQLTIAGSKTNSNITSSTAVASNINSSGNIVIKSGLDLLNNDSDLLAGTVGNTTITGSNIASTSGDIDITSKNNTIINASKDTYNSSTKSSSWSESITLASSTVGAKQLDAAIQSAQLALNLAMNKAKGDTSSTTYKNSNLTAENGSININSLGTTSSGTQTGGDTTISGANLLASNVTINSQGDLTVESLQDSYKDKSKSFGMNLGLSGGSGGGSVSAGINYSSSKTDRVWTDNQTSILGTNSVTINTDDNTNIKGAVIANSTNGIIGENAIDGGNLTLNTNTLTFENLFDHEYSQSTGAGFSTSIGIGANNSNGQGTASSSNPNQQNNFYPSGSTTISAQNSGYKKEQTTFATIGLGDITTKATLTFDADGNLTSSAGGTLLSSSDSSLANLNRDANNSQVITKDTITNALNASITIDNRLIGAAFGNEASQTSLKNDQKNLGHNLAVTTGGQIDLAKKVWASPNTALSASWGLLGVTVGAMMGRDVAITFNHNAIQFEGSPLVSRAFTLGNATNYPTVGANDGGPDSPLKESYTYIFKKAKIGDHEEPHTYQAEQLGTLFLPAYIIRGVIGNYQAGQSIFSMPNSKYNPYEIEADNHGKTKE